MKKSNVAIMRGYLIKHASKYELEPEWVQAMNLEELEYYYNMDLFPYENRGPEL